MILDPADNLYGARPAGGLYQAGYLYTLSPSGVFAPLYSFGSSSTDGAYPNGVSRDSAGNLYGTTNMGGAHGLGTVFKLSPTGVETVLHSFAGGTADGAFPNAGVTLDPAGSLYGTTCEGGVNGLGTLYKVSPSGHLTVLHSFQGSDGAYPSTGVIRDSASGYLYGTTFEGGQQYACCAPAWGTVYQFSPNRVLTVLHSFQEFPEYADGYTPSSGVVLDSSGNLYGTTESGGTGIDGTVYKLSASSPYAETQLYQFTGPSTSLSEGVVLDSAGNLYGSTNVGGAGTLCPDGCGTVYKLSASGVPTILHSFTGGADGAYPSAVVLHSDYLYGATLEGGANGFGTIFKISKKGVITVLYSF